VFVASYPADSIGIVRAASEVGLQPKVFGGAMVGLQSTGIKTQLGPLLNGIVNFDYWLPAPTLVAPGVLNMLARYQAEAGRVQADPLGYYLAPWAYAQLQVLQHAIESTGSLDDETLASYMRSRTFSTVVGDIEFGLDGEWTKSRLLLIQFQRIASREVSEFADIHKMVILSPPEHKTGELAFPYAEARRP
jgi:branched-chain amino acid transport system substrate-binding protein